MMAPEVQHIAITMPDGAVAMMQIIVRAPISAFGPDAAIANGFVVGFDDQGREFWDGGITDEGVEAEIRRSGIVGHTGWLRIPAEGVPADRAFRNAWVLGRGKISIDMLKAREIHRDRMRAARAPKLAALDVEYQRADEEGNAALKAEIVAKKRELRDITADPEIERAKSPSALSAVWPSALV